MNEIFLLTSKRDTHRRLSTYFLSSSRIHRHHKLMSDTRFLSDGETRTRASSRCFAFQSQMVPAKARSFLMRHDFLDRRGPSYFQAEVRSSQNRWVPSTFQIFADRERVAIPTIHSFLIASQVAQNCVTVVHYPQCSRAKR